MQVGTKEWYDASAELIKVAIAVLDMARGKVERKNVDALSYLEYVDKYLKLMEKIVKLEKEKYYGKN